MTVTLIVFHPSCLAARYLAKPSRICERRVENDRFLLTLLVKLLRHLIDLVRAISIQELLSLQARLDILKRDIICPHNLPLQNETDHPMHMRISSGSVHFVAVRALEFEPSWEEQFLCVCGSAGAGVRI